MSLNHVIVPPLPEPTNQEPRSYHELYGPDLKAPHQVRENEWIRGHAAWDNDHREKIQQYWELEANERDREAQKEVDKACKRLSIEEPTWVDFWLNSLRPELDATRRTESEHSRINSSLREKYATHEVIAEGNIYATDSYLTTSEAEQLRNACYEATQAETALLQRMRKSFLDRDHLRQVRNTLRERLERFSGLQRRKLRADYCKWDHPYNGNPLRHYTSKEFFEVKVADRMMGSIYETNAEYHPDDPDLLPPFETSDIEARYRLQFNA